jgi:streptogramin lyase
VTTAGEITSYPRGDIGDVGLRRGPDGALWFADYDSIGRIAVNGRISRYTNPRMDVLGDLLAGPDGALWFMNVEGDSLWDRADHQRRQDHRVHRPDLRRRSRAQRPHDRP